MARRDISRLCEAVLPPGFEQARRQIPRIQAFLRAKQVSSEHIDAAFDAFEADTPDQDPERPYR